MSSRGDASGRTYTIEEYERLPEDDRYRDELVRGRLVREPQPGEEHGWLEIRLGHFLYEFVEARQLGVVLGAAGYILEETPAPTIRGPDLSFLARERVEGGYPARRFLASRRTSRSRSCPRRIVQRICEKRRSSS